MNKFAKKLTCAALIASMGVTGLTGCGDTLDGTKTVATCDGEKESLGVASFLVRYSQAQMETYYGAMMAGNGGGMWDQKMGEGNETYGDSTKKSTMDQLEEMMLLKAHAEEYKVSITDEEKAKIEETAKTFMDANNEETLKALAVNQADIVEALTLYTYQNKMRTPMTADVDTNVTDEEAAQTTVTYVKISTAGTTGADNKTTELTEEEKAAKKVQAEEVLTKATAASAAGGDMDAIAKEVDEKLMANVSSFGADDTILDDAVKTTAKTLAEGETAGQVVEGKDAYYVVRLDKMFDEEATKGKKERILTKRKQDAYQAIIDGWKEKAEFKIEEAVWKKLKVTDQHSFKFKQEPQPEQTPNTDSVVNQVEQATEGSK